MLDRTLIKSTDGTILRFPKNRDGQGGHVIKTGSTMDNWFIGDFCLVTVPTLVLGGNCQINAGAMILGRETVEIGRGSVVSYGVKILTSTDCPDPQSGRKHNDFDPEDQRLIKSAPITIGKECFVGADSILMPGVVLPDKAVIPAGAFVEEKNGETVYQHWKFGKVPVKELIPRSATE